MYKNFKYYIQVEVVCIQSSDGSGGKAVPEFIIFFFVRVFCKGHSLLSHYLPFPSLLHSQPLALARGPLQGLQPGFWPVPPCLWHHRSCCSGACSSTDTSSWTSGDSLLPPFLARPLCEWSAPPWWAGLHQGNAPHQNFLSLSTAHLAFWWTYWEIVISVIISLLFLKFRFLTIVIININNIKSLLLHCIGLRAQISETKLCAKCWSQWPYRNDRRHVATSPHCIKVRPKCPGYGCCRPVLLKSFGARVCTVATVQRSHGIEFPPTYTYLPNHRQGYAINHDISFIASNNKLKPNRSQKINTRTYNRFIRTS